MSKQELELPKGWILTDLITIASSKKHAIVDGPFGSQLKKNEFKEKGIPVIEMANLQNDVLITSFRRYITKEKFSSLERSSVTNDDIIISKTGTLGKLAIVPKEINDAIITSRLAKMSFNQDIIDLSFVFLFLKNLSLSHYWEKISKGTTMKILTIKNLSTPKILLPPLNEQKRIVSKIEELFSKIDSTKQSLEQTKLQLELYRQSLLKSAFEGKITKNWREQNKDKVGNVSKFLEKFTDNNLISSISKPSKSSIPEIWDFVLSNHVFDFITSGSRGWAKFYSETGSIFIRITNLNYNSIELDFQKIKRVNPPSNSEGIRTKVKPNDILISITGDVGMIALVPKDIPNAYVNQHICLARPNYEINAKYIALYLISNNGSKQFTALKKGAVKAGLGLDDIRSVWIPFPPLEEQKEIIARIEQGFSLIENTQSIVNSTLQTLQTMKMSVLKNAFEGKLVPQDPNDEPAEKLLERIKKEKS